MTIVEALKALYTALGGEAEVSGATTIVEMLNAIADLYDGADDAVLNAEAIANIAAVVPAIKTEQNKSVTPTTSQQIIEADSGKVLGKVTVAAVTAAIDENIVAGNIKNGVTILGVTGSYAGE